MRRGMWLASVLLASSVAAQAQRFGLTHQMFPPDGDASYALALGDVDGDGDLDVLVGNYGGQNRLYANDGTGVFSDVTAASLPPLVAYTRAVALGDVDGDGDLDAFIGTGVFTSPVALLLNGGGGIFANAPAGSLPPWLGLPSYARAIALGDVDGDGDLDAFVENRLLLNGGAGAFTLALAGSLGGAEAVALGDADGDGDFDVFFGGGSCSSTVLFLNGGAGTFINATTNLPPGSSYTRAIALGDVDGDGDVDAFLGRLLGTGPSQLLFLNVGGGVYVDATATNLPNPLDTTLAVALGDLDGDGDLDAFVGNLDDPVLSTGQNRLYQNGGTGVFTDVTATNFPPVLDATTAVALGDLDGDGDLDALAANDEEQNRLYLNDGQGILVSGQATSFPPAVDSTAAVGVGDVDGDGDLDAWAGNTDSFPGGQDRLFLNSGAGVFSDATTTNLPPVLDRTAAVALGDLDGDGDLDAYVGNSATFGPSAGDRLYLNGGAGAFADVTATNLPAVLDFTWAVALGDVDGDGDLDALTGNAPPFGADQSRLFLNGGTAIFSNVTATNLPALSRDTRAVALGDVDGDGDIDAFLGNSGTGGQAENLWLNGGTGVFADASATNLPPFADLTRAVGLGDVDGDGDLDAFVGNEGQDRLYLNGGVGVFAAAPAGSLPVEVEVIQALALGDFDEDGDLDAFLGRAGQNRLYLNGGSGTFSDVTAADVPGFLLDTRSLAAGDVDGDGDLDVVAGVPDQEIPYTNLTRQLSWRGIPRTGRLLTLDLWGPANSGWLLAAAAGSAIVPLPPVGTLRLHPPTTFVVAGGLLDPQGRASVTFPVPANPALVGASLYWQAIVGPPFRFTNLEITTVTSL
ncbi:MAG: VCBS repeat-containing protein [Planctomycetes bacterium]|nr:VCBS repeat-containing protein [Planctomycetota bacterium]